MIVAFATLLLVWVLLLMAYQHSQVLILRLRVRLWQHYVLRDSEQDLRRRIENMVLGITFDDKPFRVRDLGVAGAITVLLMDAIKPNLVQTLEGTAAFVHGGPFANIAHGCNSLVATKMAMSLSDYAITEAGFGADLGAEKFLDIKCRKAEISSSCNCSCFNFTWIEDAWRTC